MIERLRNKQLHKSKTENSNGEVTHLIKKEEKSKTPRNEKEVDKNIISDRTS